MAEYYVSAAGNDANSGSYSSPWQTMARVNTAIGTGGPVGLKNRVRFRRGDTFYGMLRPSSTLTPSNPGWLRIGAYGDGAAPILSGYKILNTAGGWTAYDANTWQLSYSTANSGITYTGNGTASDTATEFDVGFLKVDGVIKGVKRQSLGALANQWDFYSTGTTLYVRSTAKPTTLAGDVRCSVDVDGVRTYAGVEIADVTIEGYGANGIYLSRGGIGPGRTRVLRNTIREIGGVNYNDTPGFETPRYGNGITNYGNATNILIEYNTISDVYDAGYSIQGIDTGTYFSNIMFRRNLTYRCCQAEEYAYFAGTGPGFVNVRSEYNTHLFCGYGFGGDTRPDTKARGGLQSYQWGDLGSGYVADVSIRRNIYWDCRQSYRVRPGSYPATGLLSNHNVIALRPGTLMQNDIAALTTVENASTWVAAEGIEQKSKFITLPASADVDISNADVTTALGLLNANVRSGQVMATQAPWT
jgi:hypothetical protein